MARLDADTLELVSYVDAGGVIQWDVAEVPGTDQVIATGLLGQLYELNMTSGTVTVGRSRDITSLAGSVVSPDGTLIAANHGFTSSIARFDAETLLPIGRPIPVGEQRTPRFTPDGDLVANSRSA